MNPKISIIVPVYKVEKYLYRCIDSILSQSFTDFELLLIDDGSPDNCGATCDDYAAKDPRVRVFHKENGGVSSARNLGLENAVGEWIWFVDSDDTVEANALNIINTYIENADGSELCFYFGMNKIDRFKKEVISPPEDTILASEFMMRILSYSVITAPYLYIYRRSSLSQLFFDTNLEIGEDLCYHLQVMALNPNKPVVQCNHVIYNYMINSDSVMQRKDFAFVQKYMNLSKYIYEQYYNSQPNNNFNDSICVNIYKNFIQVFRRLYDKDFISFEKHTKDVMEQFNKYPIMPTALNELSFVDANIIIFASESAQKLHEYLKSLNKMTLRKFLKSYFIKPILDIVYTGK